MMKKIAQKLKNKGGESISEVLVALLISSLALVMLASMIGTTTRLVTRSKDTMREYYQAANILELMENEAGDTHATAIASLDISIENGGNLRINVPPEKLTGYENQQLGKHVYSYMYAP